MTTQAAKQARLDALKKARDSGALIVRHGDTSITYRSIDAINQTIRDLEREISDLAGTVRRGARYIYQPGKGL